MRSCKVGDDPSTHKKGRKRSKTKYIDGNKNGSDDEGSGEKEPRENILARKRVVFFLILDVMANITFKTV